MNNLAGKKVGKLTPIECVGSDKHKNILWRCLCDCGNETIVCSRSLVTQNTRSCGCLKVETIVKRNTKHGDALFTRKSRLYTAWCNMLGRCENPNREKYRIYGARGITICREWHDYMNFKKWALENGYEDTLTIDRIDVNGNYEPSNCRWATLRQQANNTRQNVFISFGGETHTVTEWSRIKGINVKALMSRFNLGWSIDKALTQPLRGCLGEHI